MACLRVATSDCRLGEGGRSLSLETLDRFCALDGLIEVRGLRLCSPAASIDSAISTAAVKNEAEENKSSFKKAIDCSLGFVKVTLTEEAFEIFAVGTPPPLLPFRYFDCIDEIKSRLIRLA